MHEKRTKPMATVKGARGDGMPVEFTLSPFDIKHIRRCIHVYNRIHPCLNSDETYTDHHLYFNFKQFGRITAFSSKSRKEIRAVKPRLCVECGRKKNLTVDHIIPRRNGGPNTLENTQILCKPCHEEKNLRERIEIKEQELILLKQQFEEVKKRNTSVLSSPSWHAYQEQQP